MLPSTRLLCCVAIAALFTASLVPSALRAHHSFSAEYDAEQAIKITGVVTKVEWQNPHVWLYLDVTNDDGSKTAWAISGGAPGQLFRRGITKANIPIGAEVTVDGFRAKDGSNNGNGRSVTFPDGRSVFTAGDPGPDKGGDAKGKGK